MEGRCIHQHINIVKDMATIIDKATVGEGEETMMNALKDFILEGRVGSPFDEGVTPGGGGDDTSGEVGVKDILVIQISSINSLLGDIYKL